MNELEVFKQLSKTQPHQERLKRLTDEQVEHGILVLGEWRYVFACEAATRNLHKGYSSLRDYFRDHLHMPLGTARDLADRVSVALELASELTGSAPPRDSGHSDQNAHVVASMLTRDQSRELARDSEALAAARDRIAQGEEPQKVVGEVVPRKADKEEKLSKDLRGNVGTTPLNKSVEKQRKWVEGYLSAIEGAVAGLLSIEEFHPKTPQEDLEDWIKRIGRHADKTLVHDISTVRKRMIERRDST